MSKVYKKLNNKLVDTIGFEFRSLDFDGIIHMLSKGFHPNRTHNNQIKEFNKTFRYFLYGEY